MVTTADSVVATSVVEIINSVVKEVVGEVVFSNSGPCSEVQLTNVDEDSVLK